MISVVVPVYNVQLYLVKCIESIIKQTYSNWELILINDGSTDLSGDIANSYALQEKRIKVIHQENKGVSSARNRGIEEVQGEYICFIDSDDWVDPDFLEQFNVDEKNADFYVSGALYNVADKIYSYKKYDSFYSNDANLIGKEYVRQNLFMNGYTWGKLFKTQIVRKYHCLFNNTLSYNEDHLFVFEYVSYIQSIVITNTANYHYLVFDNSDRKLSKKFNCYAKLLLTSNLFESNINLLSDSFNFSDTVKTDLYKKFVIETRLQAAKALFKEPNSSINNIIRIEKTFWINYINKNTVNTSRMNKLVLFILTKINSIFFIKIILNIIIRLAHKLHRYREEKLCYKDLSKRSDIFLHKMNS